MLIKIKTKSVKEEQIEVTFPCFSRHDLEYSTVFHKLDAVGGRLTLYSIDLDNRDGKVEIEIETIPADLGENGYYYLGYGEFESNGAEWADAVDRAGQIFAKVA
jgi:hypothetical protein